MHRADDFKARHSQFSTCKRIGPTCNVAPVLKILGVPRLPPGGSLGGSPPGGSLGTGKRGTVPKIWRAVPIFFSACKWGLRHKTGLCCGIWRYCERSFPILTGGKVLHSRKVVQFKGLLDIHGEQFRTVSGSMRRLTLSLINLVKTLEITTKQLKNVILHILK